MSNYERIRTYFKVHSVTIFIHLAFVNVRPEEIYYGLVLPIYGVYHMIQLKRKTMVYF
jgi:hypothetical protein